MTRTGIDPTSRRTPSPLLTDGTDLPPDPLRAP